MMVMTDYTPLQQGILDIVQEEFSKKLVDQKCELTVKEYHDRLKNNEVGEFHKNSIGKAIDTLADKYKEFEKETVCLARKGWTIIITPKKQ